MLKVTLVFLWWTITPTSFAALQKVEVANSKSIRATPPPSNSPPRTFSKAGLIKMAWPELRFESVDVARAKLRQARVENVYVLSPGADPNPTGFAVVNGTDQDVWLYATCPSDMDIVYETPVRGSWHHNRDKHSTTYEGCQVRRMWWYESRESDVIECEVSKTHCPCGPAGMDPGWPELVGQDYMKAIDPITNSIFGVTVIYGPARQPRLLDLGLDRVYLDGTVSGTVATIPFVGADRADVCSFDSTGCKSLTCTVAPQYRNALGLG